MGLLFFLYSCVWVCVQAAYEVLVLLLQNPLLFLVCTWGKTPQGWRGWRQTSLSVCTKGKWQVEDTHLWDLCAVTQTLSVRNYWYRKPLKQDIPHGSQKSVPGSPGQREELTLQCAISFQSVKGSWVSPDHPIIHSESSTSCHVLLLCVPTPGGHFPSYNLDTKPDKMSSSLYWLSSLKSLCGCHNSDSSCLQIPLGLKYKKEERIHRIQVHTQFKPHIMDSEGKGEKKKESL